jgi:hypothetical protein
MRRMRERLEELRRTGGALGVVGRWLPSCRVNVPGCGPPVHPPLFRNTKIAKETVPWGESNGVRRTDGAALLQEARLRRATGGSSGVTDRRHGQARSGVALAGGRRAAAFAVRVIEQAGIGAALAAKVLRSARRAPRECLG